MITNRRQTHGTTRKTHNHHEPPGKQTKQSNMLSLPHQDDCKTRMDIKIVSEYDQEISQSQTADNPMAPSNVQQSLGWWSLEQKRSDSRLCLFY